MSNTTHFCGSEFLAWKSSSVKCWTNIMSGLAAINSHQNWKCCWWDSLSRTQNPHPAPYGKSRHETPLTLKMTMLTISNHFLQKTDIFQMKVAQDICSFSPVVACESKRRVNALCLQLTNSWWHLVEIVNIVIFKVTHSTQGFHVWICHGRGGDLGSYQYCLTSSIFSSDESLLPLNCPMGTKRFLVLKDPLGTIESHPQAVRNWGDKIVSDYMPSRQI